MSHNLPPAPDWVRGADGHWKPPPFDGAHAPGQVARVVADPMPTTMGQLPVGPSPAANPPRRTGMVVAIVVGSVVAGFVALAFLAVVAVTFLGTTAEPRSTAIPDGSVSATDPASDATPTSAPADAEVDRASFCPTAEEVAAATRSAAGVMTPIEGGSLEVEGIDLRGGGCRYQDDSVVLALDDASWGRADDLLDHSGEIASLDVYYPESVSPDGEKVGTLFEANDEIYVVLTPGTDRPKLLTLVASVRALVE